jgi:hypothetical protein
MIASAESECLAEDEILALARGALADTPASEAHLANCAACSALLAACVRRTGRSWDSLAGTTLGPYRIDAQIGAGGMGAVYRAWDPRLERTLAVKVLHAGSERGAIEARAAAAIDHRAIVGIHDVGEADGLHYVAMELVTGESLRSVLDRGSVGPRRSRELVIELVDALVAAHARGVVHRDLKPENLVLARDGLRILDFGLAKFSEPSELDVTEPGTILGTAGYMAPEQARGEPVDARTDLFAVGAIAYELATGRRAFPGATQVDRLSATLRDTPAADELAELAPVVMRCLEKQPSERFQTAVDLAWTLRQTPAAIENARPSRRALLIGGAAAAVVGIAGYLIGRRGRAATIEYSFRPITHRVGRVYTARFAPDGNRVYFGAAWSSDPVRIHELDLASGQTTVLDLGTADLLAISPHDELAVGLDMRFVDHQSARGKLARLTLGGVPRPLLEDVQDADFGRDALAVIRAVGSGFRVEFPIGTTFADEPTWITHLRVSPDGARVAYLRHPHTNDDGGALVVGDVASRTTKVLSEGWVSIAGLAWDPSGDALLFTGSKADLDNRLYRSSLTGTVIPVASPSASRLRIHDVSADRRALVTNDAWHLRAIAGERDVSIAETSYVSDLSADGSQVVIGELGELEAGRGAYLAPYKSGPALRLGDGFPVAISPSGEHVAANDDSDDHLIVYSTRSGETPRIATPGSVLVARWLDERSLIAHCKGQLWRIAFDIAPVALAEAAGSFALDPTRMRCAYLDRARVLRVLELATGTSRAFPNALGSEEVCGWLATPDAIVLRSTSTPLVLDRVDVSTGARTRHLEVQPPLLGLKAVDAFVLHPDGERYAYSYGQELSQLGLLTLA